MEDGDKWWWVIGEGYGGDYLGISVISETLRGVWEASDQVMKDNQVKIEMLQERGYYPQMNDNQPTFVNGVWKVTWIVVLYQRVRSKVSRLPYKLDANNMPIRIDDNLRLS